LNLRIFYLLFTTASPTAANLSWAVSRIKKYLLTFLENFEGKSKKRPLCSF